MRNRGDGLGGERFRAGARPASDGAARAGRAIERPSDDRKDRPRPGGEFHLFVYGTLRSGGGSSSMLGGSQLVGSATVEGTLYDLGEYPALMLYGGTPVEGEIWRCPAAMLWKLDEYEGVERGLFRRVAIMAGGRPCWAYVAGPKLGQKLTPDRRLRDGRWAGGAAT